MLALHFIYTTLPTMNIKKQLRLSKEACQLITKRTNNNKFFEGEYVSGAISFAEKKGYTLFSKKQNNKNK